MIDEQALREWLEEKYTAIDEELFVPPKPTPKNMIRACALHSQQMLLAELRTLLDSQKEEEERTDSPSFNMTISFDSWNKMTVFFRRKTHCYYWYIKRPLRVTYFEVEE